MGPTLPIIDSAPYIAAGIGFVLMISGVAAGFPMLAWNRDLAYVAFGVAIAGAAVLLAVRLP